PSVVREMKGVLTRQPESTIGVMNTIILLPSVTATEVKKIVVADDIILGTSGNLSYYPFTSHQFAWRY
ncbi:942_t:CDS:2, partial [Funneliformis geosporum]